jgi:hypothetical protein
VSRPRWILDGGPYYVEDLVYPATDTVIVLDYAKPVVMCRVLRRTLAVELLRRPPEPCALNDAGTPCWVPKQAPL